MCQLSLPLPLGTANDPGRSRESSRPDQNRHPEPEMRRGTRCGLKQDSRYIGLTMPRFPPPAPLFAEKVAAKPTWWTGGFDFEEAMRGWPTGTKYVWSNARLRDGRKHQPFLQTLRLVRNVDSRWQSGGAVRKIFPPYPTDYGGVDMNARPKSPSLTAAEAELAKTVLSLLIPPVKLRPCRLYQRNRCVRKTTGILRSGRDGQRQPCPPVRRTCPPVLAPLNSSNVSSATKSVPLKSVRICSAG